MYLRDTIVVDMRLLGCGDMLRAYRLHRVYHTCGALSRKFFRDLVPPFLSTCSLLIKLRLLISFAFYKETVFGFGFYSGFTSREYHIALVDFIVALRRTKGRGRRTLRSPPSPWNHACVVQWTPPHPPGVSAAAGHFGCRG